MSEIKVNKISPRSGTTLTLGDSGDDFIIPAGATLTNNGTASGFASIAWQSTIVTGSTLTAVAGNGYWIDTTSNACTITLPGSASVGDQLIFSDYARTWGTNKIIIDSNGLNYQGDPDTSTVEYNTNGQSINIVYSGATKGWIPISDDDVTDAPISPPYSVDFLVVAGGGAGGTSDHGGGGGAGGYRTSTQTVNGGVSITVTVGSGGAAGTLKGTRGGNGSASSISGSGLTTISSAGGGAGGATNGANQSSGISGGSGGGSAYTPNNTAGSGNTPSTSPSQGNNGGIASPSTPNYGGGGGGGADATGGNGTSTVGGAGGNGTANSITGSSVYYAGGGGGSVYNGGTGGTGGLGGGGAGSTAQATNGTANTGGGGGGNERDQNNGNDFTFGTSGGSGVVILSMPDASYSGTTTGSPTVATGVSGKTVLTFTGSGSYTT
jgi:hypothetical protein